MTVPIASVDARREESRQATGQFGPQMHADPGVVDLWDPADGSYAFPPIPRDPADVVAFWKSIDIPDEALEMVVARSEAFAAEVEQSARDNVLMENESLRLRAEGGRATQADLDAWKSVQSAAEVAARNHAPAVVQRAIAKPIFRLASMAYWAGYLTPSERNSVLATQFRLPGGQLATPEAIWDHYSFDSFYEEIVNRPSPVDASSAMLEMAANISWMKDRGVEQREIERDKAMRSLAKSAS